MHRSHTDVDVAIRDAFDAMRRQLEDYATVLRREVKSHPGTDLPSAGHPYW